jgi:hypothetical protein
MDVRISPRATIQQSTSEPRQTPVEQNGAFAQTFARTAIAGAEQAAMTIPGAPIMSLALRGGTMGAASLIPGPAGGVAGVGVPGVGIPGSGVGAATPTPEGPSPGGNFGLATGGAAGASGIDGSLLQSQEMNLYFLQVQEQVNAQNRSFTTLSNVLKAQHETVKTAIGNIR